VGRHGDDRPQVPARPSLVRHLPRARDLPGGAGTLLPTETLSVYDFAVDLPNLVPTEDDTRMFMATVERRYADPTVLEREIEAGGRSERYGRY
jgi:hypothetical protein